MSGGLAKNWGGSDARGGAPSWTWQWHVIGTNERLDWAVDASSQFRRDVVLVPQAGVEPATFRIDGERPRAVLANNLGDHAWDVRQNDHIRHGDGAGGPVDPVCTAESDTVSQRIPRSLFPTLFPTLC